LQTAVERQRASFAMTQQHVAACRIEVALRSKHFFLPSPPSPCILLTVDFADLLQVR
jgi:hypothetical protein